MSYQAPPCYQFEFYAEEQDECLRGLCVKSDDTQSPPFFRVEVARQLRRGPWRGLDAIVHDFLDIAGVVMAADRLARRRLVPNGFGWPRRLVLAVPVREPDFWRAGDTSRMFECVLRTLTGDYWCFDWSHRPASDKRRRVFTQSALLKTDDVPVEAVLQSGGLDALCGACDLLQTHERAQLTLVSVQTGGRTVGAQREVLDHLRTRFPGRALGLETPLILPRACQDDNVHRSRSFAFVVIGSVAALARGAERLYQCENGVAALCLPLFPSAFEWQTFRGTHPTFLRDMGNLISKVFRKNFRIENPYLLQTKAEMCLAVRRAGLERVIGVTVSCDRFPQRIEHRPLCGKCGPCLLRRQALFGAELQSEDPIDRYRYDVIQPELAIPRNGRQALIGMLDQYERLKRCLAASEPWASMVDLYPQLETTKRDIAALSKLTEAGVESGVLSLLRRYVREWDLFPVSKSWVDPIQMKDRRRVRRDSEGSLELPGLSSSRE